MGRKPPASLSAGLVAVKGMAVPAPDMPVRGPSDVPVTKPDAAPGQADREPGAGESGGMPLNFRVPAAFRRDFKVYAATHGLKLNELLRRCFEAYRSQPPGQNTK